MADDLLFPRLFEPVRIGKVPELYSVGDCNRPRVILEAVYEGSLAGRQI